MASSIPAAKAALLTALQKSAITPLDNATVIKTGDWTGRQPAEDLVVVETSREIDRAWAGMGNLRLEESFVLVVAVEVRHRGGDLTAVEARMWELVTAIERTVLADVTLGGTVRQTLPDGAPEGETVGPIDAGGVAAAIDLRFACVQRVALT